MGCGPGATGSAVGKRVPSSAQPDMVTLNSAAAVTWHIRTTPPAAIDFRIPPLHSNSTAPRFKVSFRAAQSDLFQEPLAERPAASGSNGEASVPIPKFARHRGTPGCELRNQRDTSNVMILV